MSNEMPVDLEPEQGAGFGALEVYYGLEQRLSGILEMALHPEQHLNRPSYCYNCMHYRKNTERNFEAHLIQFLTENL